MLFKRPEPALDHSRLLDAVPVRNDAVREDERQGRLVLWVPLRDRWWMKGPLSWWLPFRRERGIELDGLGREVWATCNGQTKLEEIVENFAERHQLRFHEARVSVVSFLNSLVERRLVVLMVPDDAIVEDQAKKPPRKKQRRRGRS